MATGLNDFMLVTTQTSDLWLLSHSRGLTSIRRSLIQRKQPAVIEIAAAFLTD